ncbi:MAG TPA: hypothetical protein PKC45_07450 [Gemmatales bacterium]|nr:hypothetical protein [Gemmatales bacterium]
MGGVVQMRRWLVPAVAWVLLTLASGCVSVQFHAPGWPPCWPWEERPPIGEVGQVVALWGDGVVMQPDPGRNGQITPGFNGKVYLIDGQKGQALGADGHLVVSLFDTSDPTGQTPREVWEIDPVNLKKVCRKDGVGWGYALWLPWTTAHLPMQHVTLVVKYRPASGREVWSTPSNFRVREGNALQPASNLNATTTNVGPTTGTP